MSTDDTPMSQLLFEIEVLLSERFPALSPVELRRTKAREVFKIINKLTIYSKKEKREQTKAKTRHIIKRQASDTWF